MTPKLLLADDSVTIQRVIELTFADENVQVVAVGDGKQAIDRVLTDRPDIVLADVGMPGRDGYEVAAFIKGQPQLAHIPVLLLTGAFEPIDEARARSVGCDGVLVKPFEPQMVISRVRDLLTGRRTSSQPATAQPAAPPDAPASSPAPPAAPSAGAQLDAAPEDTGQSLEDYFDRLDAALATIGPAGAASPIPPALEPIRVAPSSASFAAPASEAQPATRPTGALGGWDPDLSVSPPTPAPRPIPVVSANAPPAEPAAPAPAAVRVVPLAPEPRLTTGADRPTPPAAAAVTQPPPGAAPVSSALPSLSDAFAALLAAEQGHPVPTALFAAPQAAAPAVTEEVIEDIVRRVIARMGDESMRRAVLDAAERLVREEIDRIKQFTR